jgi:ubiquinone/menaquinone biosynthesis C-methylase UbiE
VNVGFYAKYCLPKVVHFTCSLKPTMRQRRKVVPLAEGRVLEIGIGSGLNLPFYDESKVTHLWGLDPSGEMWEIAEKKRGGESIPVEFLEAGAEEIPLDNGSADTIVMTYTLCTIPDALASLSEMRRVLRPAGQLVFCEHGEAPDDSVRKWQDRLNPVWKRFGGGCNLNRRIPSLLEEGGFSVQRMEATYLPGWKPASFNYWGTAIAAQQGSQQ